MRKYHASNCANMARQSSNRARVPAFPEVDISHAVARNKFHSSRHDMIAFAPEKNVDGATESASDLFSVLVR
jgi:hypothetical protein